MRGAVLMLTLVLLAACGSEGAPSVEPAPAADLSALDDVRFGASVPSGSELPCYFVEWGEGRVTENCLTDEDGARVGTWNLVAQGQLYEADGAPLIGALFVSPEELSVVNVMQRGEERPFRVSDRSVLVALLRMPQDEVVTLTFVRNGSQAECELGGDRFAGALCFVD